MEIKPLNHAPKEILEKIQKLKRLADAAGSPEEAANAAEKMQSILIKYNIDLASALDYKPEDTLVFTQEWDLNTYQGRHDANFAKDLINAVCKLNFCKVVNGNQNKIKYDQGYCRIFGSKINMELSEYMVMYCVNQMEMIEKAHWKLYTGGSLRNAYRRGFYRACVTEIVRRMTENIKAQASDSMALMVISNQIVSQKAIDYYAQRGMGLTSGRSTKKNLASNDGKIAGREAGKNMNLHKGLSGQTSSNQGRLN